MKILDKCLTEEPGTVEVAIRTKTDKELKIFVQTVDSVYRKDLGCIAYSDVDDGTLNEKDISSEDLDIVIKEAEDFMRNAYKIKYINPDYVFKIFNNKVMLSAVNRQFVNVDATPYQQEYHDINLFNTLEEAEAFVTATLEKED